MRVRPGPGRYRCAPPPARTRGFTLLEVLLAFIIFALSFATVLEILSGSMRSSVRAREYSQAALTAQSLMDMVGTEVPLMETMLGGETPDGYRWNLEIFLYQGEPDNPRTLELAEMNGTLLYWVDLNLEWGEGRRARSARFSTVRSVLANFEP